jgi:hypothetical protein
MKYKIVERGSFKVMGFKRAFSTVNGENLRAGAAARICGRFFLMAAKTPFLAKKES